MAVIKTHEHTVCLRDFEELLGQKVIICNTVSIHTCLYVEYSSISSRLHHAVKKLIVLIVTIVC